MEMAEVEELTGVSHERGTAIHGYSRAEVDEFLAAAGTERARLERDIADARARISRARSALGMHRVMVAMLLDAQRELSDLRQDAERRAEEIVAQAHADSAETPHVIDLAASDSNDQWMSTNNPIGASADALEAGEDYFDFLRGALADDTPLGPSAE
jgi:cell division septum initiation protein DivIVA